MEEYVSNLIGNLIGWISAVTAVFGVVFALILAIVGFVAFKLRKDAEKELEEVRDIKNKTNMKYNEILNEKEMVRKEYDKLLGETHKKANKFFSGMSAKLEYLDKRVLEIDKTQKRIKGSQKKKTKKEKELDELLEEVKQLRNRLLHDFREAAISMPATVSGLSANINPMHTQGYFGTIVKPENVVHMQPDNIVDIKPEYFIQNCKLCGGVIGINGKCLNPNCSSQYNLDSGIVNDIEGNDSTRKEDKK